VQFPNEEWFLNMIDVGFFWLIQLAVDCCYWLMLLINALGWYGYDLGINLFICARISLLVVLVGMNLLLPLICRCISNSTARDAPSNLPWWLHNICWLRARMVSSDRCSMDGERERAVLVRPVLQTTIGIECQYWLQDGLEQVFSFGRPDLVL
jgi:uncharacterized protein YhhL (DUF1145 family)